MAFKKETSGDLNGYIGSSLKLEGKLFFPGKVRFEGELQGELRGESLIIGEGGKIVGEVEAEEILCAGQVEGKLVCKNLNLKKTARIKGEIFTERLSVEEGARLEGQIRAGEGARTPPSEAEKGAS
ncbi:bactofilin family protein [Thermosulfurimonas marina]|uniref:bactofilin family protein n=1 Tax=Thermosulfurimonas marina TaxID=2047767 RepID=UPI00144AEC4B|nr:polymer-forming cytoskeletal protein [Thermosulfurimonas marina]